MTPAARPRRAAGESEIGCLESAGSESGPGPGPTMIATSIMAGGDRLNQARRHSRPVQPGMPAGGPSIGGPAVLESEPACGLLIIASDSDLDRARATDSAGG